MLRHFLAKLFYFGDSIFFSFFYTLRYLRHGGLLPAGVAIKLFNSLYNPQHGMWSVPGGIPRGIYPLTSLRAAIWLRMTKDTNCASIEKEVGDFFQSFVTMTRSKLILETGTCYGYSALRLAAGLEEIGGGHIYTIDVLKQNHVFLRTQVEKYISFMEGRSDEVSLKSLPKGVKTEFDLLVLDSDHRYDTISAEINRFAPMLKMNGYILFHDSLFFDGVGLAVKSLQDSGSFEVVTLKTPRESEKGVRSPGVTVMRKIATFKSMPIKKEWLGIDVNMKGRDWKDVPLLFKS